MCADADGPESQLRHRGLTNGARLADFVGLQPAALAAGFSVPRMLARCSHPCCLTHGDDDGDAPPLTRRGAPRVWPFATAQILNLKTMLQEKEGIDVKQIRLIHNGRQLADDKTLEACGVIAGTTLHMVLALRGGR